MYDFGKILRKHRLKKHWTQKHLGNLIGVSEGTISKYESNQVPPPFEKMKSLAIELNISTDELYGLESKDKISTYGLTKDQIDILHDLADSFRNYNLNIQKKLTDNQLSILGKIVVEFTR